MLNSVGNISPKGYLTDSILLSGNIQSRDLHVVTAQDLMTMPYSYSYIVARKLFSSGQIVSGDLPLSQTHNCKISIYYNDYFEDYFI